MEQLLNAAERVPADVAWIFGALPDRNRQWRGLTSSRSTGFRQGDLPHVFPDSIAIQYPYQFPMLQASLIRRSALLELDCFSEGLRSTMTCWPDFRLPAVTSLPRVPDVVGRYFRTSDLAENSVVVNGNFGPDYYRSRMLAFEQVIQSGRRRPWSSRYASSARGLCQVLARRGNYSRGLAWQQFRYGGVSLKGVAFFMRGYRRDRRHCGHGGQLAGLQGTDVPQGTPRPGNMANRRTFSRCIKSLIRRISPRRGKRLPAPKWMKCSDISFKSWNSAISFGRVT